MINNSASGGYIAPTTVNQFPKNQTLTQFLNTVLVGISALPQTLVRPEWQVKPPQQPDLDTNWLAFGVTHTKPDKYAYVGMNPDGSTQLQRQEGLEINCSFYGPDSQDIASIVIDGFQIQQNLEALRAANMGFTECSDPIHIPDLVNERFIDRVTMTIFLRRQIQRTYPILNIVSANGTITAESGDQTFNIEWQTET